MYDASLDQFKMHQWQFSPIQNPVYYSYSKRNNVGSFGNKSFRVYLPRVGAAYPRQQYDQVNWYGFYFGSNRNNMMYKRNEAMAIEDVSIVEMDQLLSGQAAGVNVSAASGQPGADSTIIIRGRSSLNSDNEPLYIIDGVPVSQSDFQSLSQTDIESLSVLKDAEATAIYGNRGAGGVILVTTKSGEKIATAISKYQNP